MIVGVIKIDKGILPEEPMKATKVCVAFWNLGVG